MYAKHLSLLFFAIGHTVAHPVVVHPTPLKDVTDSTFVITKQDTLNGTTVYHNNNTHRLDAPSYALPLALVNNLAGASVNAYVTGLDDNGALFLLQSDGTNYYPENPPAGQPPTPITAPIAIPLGGEGSTTTVNLNSYISAGRVWFAAGELQFFVNNGQNGPSLVEPSAVNPADPSAGVNWGFAELTWNAAQLFANISYVDFIGLVVGMLLATQSGGTQSAKGLPSGAATTICNALKAQASSDGQPWDQLCMVDSNGNPLRVISPNNLVAGSSGAFADYWTDYVNQVWDFYTNNDLTINTQGAAGNLVGRVDASTGNLEFSTGDSFAQPNAGDIFGCNSGPFANSGDADRLAIVPRLCAAFDRSTYLLSGGNVQPDGITDYSQYYSTSPTNHYSRLIHEYEIDGKGYAFAYDDVTPDGGSDQSGAVSDPAPSVLTLYVGGPSS